jgi:hypothetical protein
MNLTEYNLFLECPEEEKRQKHKGRKAIPHNQNTHLEQESKGYEIQNRKYQLMKCHDQRSDMQK